MAKNADGPQWRQKRDVWVEDINPFYWRPIGGTKFSEFPSPSMWLSYKHAFDAFTLSMEIYIGSILTIFYNY